MSEYTVRRLEKQDLPKRVEWYNSPEIYKNMSLNAPLSVSETQSWYQQTLMDDSRQDFCVVDEDNNPVAMAGLTDIDRENRRAELYIFVAPEQMQKGIGRITVKWLCNYSFNEYILEKIYLFTLEHNEVARELYDDLGFNKEGELRNHVNHQGSLVDRYVQSILRNEWEQSSWSQQNEIEFTISSDPS